MSSTLFNTCLFYHHLNASFKFISFASISLMKRAQKQSSVSTLPLVCQCDLMPPLWSRVWILPSHPLKLNWKSAPLVALESKQPLQQVENELEKCFWQASLTYYRVTFRYQIDGSRSWHGNLSAAYYDCSEWEVLTRESHNHDHPIHSDGETWSTDRQSCSRKVTNVIPGAMEYHSVWLPTQFISLC